MPNIERREGILARLYTLRAGLSMVRQKQEVLQEIEASEQQQISQSERSEQQANSGYNAEIRELQSSIAECEKTIRETDLDGLESTANKARRKGWLKLLLLFVLAIATLVTGVIYLAFFCATIVEFLEMTESLGGTLLPLYNSYYIPFTQEHDNLAIVCLLLGWVVPGVLGKIFFEETFLFGIRFGGREKRDLRRGERDVRIAKKDLPEQKAKLSELFQKRAAVSAQAENHRQQIRARYFSQGYPQTIVVDELYSALAKEFSTLLDERDWRYVDFIIYLFETRRVDTMKQALERVDQEVMTQRIVQAVDVAGQNVSQSIQMGLSALREDMVGCFRVLGEAICKSTEVLAGRIDQMGVQVSGEIARLANAQEMQNALIAKANVNSQRMVEEITALRQTCSAESWKIRHGVTAD